MRVNRLNEMEMYIISNGTATLQELAEKFGVSVNSVRRDMSALMERGNIRKVYGGVSAIDNGVVSPFHLRQNFRINEKRSIGQLAAEFVPDNTVVFLDSGTTVPCVVPYLAQKSGIVVVTYSQIAIKEIEKYPSLELLSLGGRFNHITCSFTGLFTLNAIASLNIPIAFMAATGVSLTHGLSNSTETEAQIKKAVTQQSQKVILMADHSKFSREAIISYYSYSDLYAVVTDRALESDFAETARHYGVIVSTPEDPQVKTTDTVRPFLA